MNNFKNELSRFKQFFKEYNFKKSKLEEKHGEMFFCGEVVVDREGSVVSEGENFVNVGYKLKGSLPKVLSNLFPYQFIFKGKKVESIESVFQGLKFPDKKMQNLVLSYSGLDANNIKIASPIDWKENGILFWQGKPINRFSTEYENFTIELFVSAIQNPLYRSVLKNNTKQIIHSIGEEDKNKTVFSRHEFEKMLNALSCFLKER